MVTIFCWNNNIRDAYRLNIYIIYFYISPMACLRNCIVVMQLVFSSSATVYGQPEKIPCVEEFELKAMNPYGRTKVYI